MTSTDVNTKMTQVLELSKKDLKAAIIEMCVCALNNEEHAGNK